MRLSSRTDLPDGMDMEYLLKRTLDEDDADARGMSTSTVERLADRIAQGRKRGVNIAPPTATNNPYLIKRPLDDDQSEARAMSTSTVETLADQIAQGRNATELVPLTKGGFSQRGPHALTVQGHKTKKSIRTFDDVYAFLSIHLCSSLILSPSATAQISRTSAFRISTLNG